MIRGETCVEFYSDVGKMDDSKMVIVIGTVTVATENHGWHG